MTLDFFFHDFLTILVDLDKSSEKVWQDNKYTGSRDDDSLSKNVFQTQVLISGI